jgi:hypothetical protein
MAPVGRAIGFAITLAIAVARAAAEATHLSADDRKVLTTPGALVEVRRTDQVPSPVWTAFAAATPDHAVTMANPGGKWQATDVILEGNLPWRRLIFAGTSDRYVLLYYERGGIAHSHHLVLFHLDGEEARMVWRAAPDSSLQSLADVPAAIQSPGVRDDPKFSF